MSTFKTTDPPWADLVADARGPGLPGDRHVGQHNPTPARPQPGLGRVLAWGAGPRGRRHNPRECSHV
jgi:hypothetical protein